MGRLFAYIANDPDRVRCALYPARSLLVTDPRGHQPAFDAWGIGFYQDEVLLQRRPRPPTTPLDFYAIARDLRSNVIVGHLRAGTVGRSKNENTHPFRYRSWLFAHHGEVPLYPAIEQELLATVPDFLRRNIRGETDSEVLFHVILARLHEAGKLDEANLPAPALRDAVRRALELVDRLARERGGAAEVSRQQCALAVTDGRILCATRRGGPVHLLRMNGLRDCPVCRETPAANREAKRVDHEHLRAVCLVADAAGPVGAPWEELPDGAIVSVSRDLGVSLDRVG